MGEIQDLTYEILLEYFEVPYLPFQGDETILVTIRNFQPLNKQNLMNKAKDGALTRVMFCALQEPHPKILQTFHGGPAHFQTPFPYESIKYSTIGIKLPFPIWTI